MASIKIIVQILQANKNIIQAKKRGEVNAVNTQTAVTPWLHHDMKCKLQNSTQANSDALLLRIAHYSLFLA
jgi:hypothetical protein